jgi:hypothetical protein
MNFFEAMKKVCEGKRVYRKAYPVKVWYSLIGNNLTETCEMLPGVPSRELEINKSDILATDWEVEEEKNDN